jgi:hypothetical protein
MGGWERWAKKFLRRLEGERRKREQEKGKREQGRGRKMEGVRDQDGNRVGIADWFSFGGGGGGEF